MSTILFSSGASLGLSSIFLGISEAAHQIAIDSIKNRDNTRYPMNQVSAAENEIDLAASRAILSRAAYTLDDYFTENDTPDLEPEDATHRAFQVIKNTASAKKFVMETSVKVVDRAITLYGGGGYLADSTLAKLYRDVRSGPLMQPWARNQAIEFIGNVAIVVDPNEE